MPQGFDRIELGGFIGRVEAEEDAYRRSGAESQGNRAGRDHGAHGAELSEHPASPNAILAISKRATDRIFMALPFLMISGMNEENTLTPSLAWQVWFRMEDGIAGSSSRTEHSAAR